MARQHETGTILIVVYDGRGEPMHASCPTRDVDWADKQQRDTYLPEVFTLLKDGLDVAYRSEEAVR